MSQGKLDKSIGIIKKFISNQNSNQNLLDPVQFISEFFDSIPCLSIIFKQLVLNTICNVLQREINTSDEMYNVLSIRWTLQDDEESFSNAMQNFIEFLF